MAANLINVQDCFKILLILVVGLLSGCPSTNPDAATPPPAAVDTLDSVGAKEDKLDSRIAAAVTVANAHADKPEVVRAETGVALAALPKPSAGDVAYAEARAAKADPAAYRKDADAMKRNAAEIDRLWSTMEAERTKVAGVLASQKAEIADLHRKLDEAKRDVWTYAGAGLALIGALSLAFASKPAGLLLILAGFACGSFALLLGTPWFLPSVAAIGLVAAIVAYVHFLRKPAPVVARPIDGFTKVPPTDDANVPRE